MYKIAFEFSNFIRLLQSYDQSKLTIANFSLCFLLEHSGKKLCFIIPRNLQNDIEIGYFLPSSFGLKFALGDQGYSLFYSQPRRFRRIKYENVSFKTRNTLVRKLHVYIKLRYIFRLLQVRFQVRFQVRPYSDAILVFIHDSSNGQNRCKEIPVDDGHFVAGF